MKKYFSAIFILFLFTNAHASKKSGMWYSRGNFYRIINDIPDTTRYYGCNGMTGNFLEPYMGWWSIPEKWEEIASPYKTLPGDSGIFIPSNGVDAWYNGKKWELLQVYGKQISSFIYDWVFCYQPTNPKKGKSVYLFYVRMGDNWGIVDYSGKELLPIEYQIPLTEAYGNDSTFINVIDFGGEHCSKIMNDTNCAFMMTHDGIFRSPGINHSLIMMKDGKFGSIDTTTGAILVPFVYEEIEVNGTDIYVVKKKGNYGYMNESAKEIIPCTFDFADPFFKQDNGEYQTTAFDKSGCNVITITIFGKIKKVHAICDF